jgi:hypothetical protein
MNITFRKIEAGFYEAEVDGQVVPALTYKAGGVWVVRVTSLEADDKIPYYFLVPGKTYREAREIISEWIIGTYLPRLANDWDDAHTPVNTEIQFGKGWNCCAAHPAKVVVFDNGARWAVCKSCASVYTGEVQELPVETVEEFVASMPATNEARVAACLAVTPVKEKVTVAQFSSLRRLAIVKGYSLRNKPLAVYKDGLLAMDFVSADMCRAWLDMHDDAFTLAELLSESAKVNLSIAQRAGAMMATMGEQHPSFDVAVQVHKDAMNAYDEAYRTMLYL